MTVYTRNPYICNDNVLKKIRFFFLLAKSFEYRFVPKLLVLCFKF